MLRRLLPFILVGALLASLASHAEEAGGQGDGAWKTAFYRRGGSGKATAKWVGGVGSTLRLPAPIQFSGSKVRVWMKPLRETEVQLAKMTLARGADRNGVIEGSPIPIRFGGAAGVVIEGKQKDLVSDEISAPITEGIWYLQQTYQSLEFSYVFDADGAFWQAGDAHDAPALKEFKRGSWLGNAYRIDVFTQDPRKVVACYGDSITQGASSTPGSGNRYPELLGRILGRPTLNLGVNGDLAFFAKGVPRLIGSLEGVDTVVFLMGINDIIAGKFTKAEDYAGVAAVLIAGLKKQGRQVYLGTISPAGGYAKFDADPQKENLRQDINRWIRENSLADGVIDFDEALRDPADPARMRAEYQSDHLHPSDRGYQKMAEVAAATIKARSGM